MKHELTFKVAFANVQLKKINLWLHQGVNLFLKALEDRAGVTEDVAGERPFLCC